MVEEEGEEEEDQAEAKPNKMVNLLKILTKPKRGQDGGFGAKVNVVSYNG